MHHSLVPASGVAPFPSAFSCFTFSWQQGGGKVLRGLVGQLPPRPEFTSGRKNLASQGRRKKKKKQVKMIRDATKPEDKRWTQGKVPPYFYRMGEV